MTPAEYDQAACRGATKAMFPYTNMGRPRKDRTENRATATAKQVCAGCPVRDACLQQALDNDERYGIWGGLTPQERHTITGRPVIRRGGPPTRDIPHGTNAGAQGHLRQGTPMCDECREGRNEYRRTRRQNLGHNAA